MALTTTDALQEYLDSRSLEYKRIIRLDGGTANFVWLVEPESDPPYIIKHAEAYVKVNPSIPFSVDRLGFEARALITLASIVPDQRLIRLPKLFRHDEESHVLVMTGSISRTLKDAYADPALDASTWGDRIGEWLARLHGSTSQMDIGDNKAAKRIYRHCYNNLARALGQYGMDEALAARINDKYGSLLETDDECVCHGDFWPGNILFGEGKTDVATVVDWEMVRRGCGATDVGQFAAEAYLLDRFRGGRGLLPAFLHGYKNAARLNETFVTRAAVHFGTHVAFWSTVVPWTSEEETGELVRFGVEMLQTVEKQGYSGLKGGILKELMDF